MLRPVQHWHTLLDMQKHDEAWHRKDMADELAEYREAHGILDTWSELSDVVYTYTRARWSGHTGIAFPLSTVQFALGVVYMIPKYTLRWRFFRTLGHTFDNRLHISEVRNPRKVAKLHTIAAQYHLDPVLFQRRAEDLLRRTFLLK